MARNGTVAVVACGGRRHRRRSAWFMAGDVGIAHAHSGDAQLSWERARLRSRPGCVEIKAEMTGDSVGIRAAARAGEAVDVTDFGKRYRHRPGDVVIQIGRSVIALAAASGRWVEVRSRCRVNRDGQLNAPG